MKESELLQQKINRTDRNILRLTETSNQLASGTCTKWPDSNVSKQIGVSVSAHADALIRSGEIVEAIQTRIIPGLLLKKQDLERSLESLTLPEKLIQIEDLVARGLMKAETLQALKARLEVPQPEPKQPEEEESEEDKQNRLKRVEDLIEAAKLSDYESKVFGIIALADKPILTNDLIEQVYKDSLKSNEITPRQAKHRLSAVLNAIKKKIEKSGLEVEIAQDQTREDKRVAYYLKWQSEKNLSKRSDPGDKDLLLSDRLMRECRMSLDSKKSQVLRLISERKDITEIARIIYGDYIETGRYDLTTARDVISKVVNQIRTKAREQNSSVVINTHKSDQGTYYFLSETQKNGE